MNSAIKYVIEFCMYRGYLFSFPCLLLFMHLLICIGILNLHMVCHAMISPYTLYLLFSFYNKHLNVTIYIRDVQILYAIIF